MDYKIKQVDDKFVVMVEKELPMNKPFWKFWGPSTKKVWVTALKKGGDPCQYDSLNKAKGFIRLTGGNLVE